MKIAIHGYGKMGRTIERVALDSGHKVVCILDIDREEPLSDAEVLIDFSHAGALDDTLARACDNRIDLVIGTTGWSDRLADVKRRVEEAGIGCVYASNFSPGANVVFGLAQRAGELVARFPQYEAGMEERHHSQKKDAPSGTALKIAAAVNEGSDGRIEPAIVSSRIGSEFEGVARGAVMAAQLLRGRKGLFRFDELVMS
jgi:4-hydroxy-tetrahydrodipicolinate reductase